MKVIVAGASGLIGHAVVSALRARGDDVKRLVRRPIQAPDEISWAPEKHQLETAAFDGVDAIINLAGENIAGGRWTEARRATIISSRVDATRTLVTTCAKLNRKPAVLINASAIGIYGDAGDALLVESSPPGLGFLPETCMIWETNAEGAARAGLRTVLMRFGLVLAREGGALAKMLPVFRCGLGGRLGAGTQWMSWVALDDVVGAILHVLDQPSCRGAFNVVAPGAVTNAEFTAALARALRRPAIFPVPAWLLRLALGSAMANETLLASARVVPQRLRETGYHFQFPGLGPALAKILGGPAPR